MIVYVLQTRSIIGDSVSAHLRGNNFKFNFAGTKAVSAIPNN